MTPGRSPATRGTIDLEGTYRVALNDEIELEVNVPKIELKDFALRARGADMNGCSFRRCWSGTSIEMPAQSVKVEKIVLDGLAAQAWMNPDGSINLQQIRRQRACERSSRRPMTHPRRPPRAPAEPDRREGAVGPWRPLGGFELTNANLAFEDRRPSRSRDSSWRP